MQWAWMGSHGKCRSTEEKSKNGCGGTAMRYGGERGGWKEVMMVPIGKSPIGGL